SRNWNPRVIRAGHGSRSWRRRGVRDGHGSRSWRGEMRLLVHAFGEFVGACAHSSRVLRSRRAKVQSAVELAPGLVGKTNAEQKCEIVLAARRVSFRVLVR